MLFTCLGSPGKPVVDTAGPLLLQPGDRVLLCSDGLWGTVERREITEQLADAADLRRVPELVEQALRNGGAKCDNVTVIAVEWEAAEDSDSSGGVSTTALGDEVFASTIQASVLGAGRAPTNSTTPRSNARSARSTKRSSAARQAARAPSEHAARSRAAAARRSRVRSSAPHRTRPVGPARDLRYLPSDQDA